jgi:hypothetical protein
MMIHGKQVITPAYRLYLRNLIQLDEHERMALRELGIYLDEDIAERIEDFPAVAAFIEGDRA